MGYFNMKKIIIIGCPGSGKTTFANKLAKKTGIELFYLDSIWHKPDKTHISREDFDKQLAKILQKDEWIIDGNYISTMELRLSLCDTVFFLDYPTEFCLGGVRARRGVARSDIPWIKTDKDTEFVEKFNVEQRPRVLSLLERYSDKNIFIFKSREETDKFCQNIFN